MAKVELTPDALEQMNQLPGVIYQRSRKILEKLKNWPQVSGAKALSGNLAGYYRIRTGDYRIRFKVEGDVIQVDQIGHRSTFYEK